MRKMKDSGIEWIGEIPEGWEVVSVKRLCTMQAGKNLTSEQIAPEGTYPVYGGNGIRGFFSDYNCDGKFLIVGRQGALCGNVHKVDGKVWATEHAVITNPTNYVDIDFLYYLLIGMDLNQYVSSTAAQPGLAVGTLLNLKTCYPCSTLEQTQISNYLNAKYSEIDTMLSKTRSSIEEYKKLKQAIITQAVTKGVRGEREMKDSGIEWAGLVPLHWGVAKIGSIGQTSSGATPLRSKEASFFDDAAIRWVRTLDLNDGLVYDSSEKITELALASSACSLMPKGTVCVAMYGGAGTIGKCGLLMSDCATNQAVCSIVCNREMVSPIFLLMQLLALKSYWMKYAVGTRKDPNISQDVVARMKILIPPLDEQKEITDYLDAKCAEIDRLIAKKEQLVKELESYKKSLIYEVVTGKREV